jgi:hypothetical protein
MFRKHYSNIAASLALFIALSGTAVAAVTLPRDSVGAPQIRTDAVRSPEIATDAVRGPEIAADAVRGPEIAADAVRSPEIAADAVRSPEIAADAVRSPEIVEGAVRSSEIRDDGILLGDIADNTRTALLPDARVAEAGVRLVPGCASGSPIFCDDLLTRTLGENAEPRNWLVQAKLTIENDDPQPSDSLDRCGLISTAATGAQTELDGDSAALQGEDEPGGTKTIVFSALVTEDALNPTISLRCSHFGNADVIVDTRRITAVEVGTVTGP